VRFVPAARMTADKLLRYLSSVPTVSPKKADRLVIYVVVRKDLYDEWGPGPMMNQVGHCCAKVAWEGREDEETQVFLAETENQMTKRTLKAKNEAELLKAVDLLKKQNIPYCLWCEEPENVNTALATWPRRESVVKPILKKFRLFR